MKIRVNHVNFKLYQIHLYIDYQFIFKKLYKSIWYNFKLTRFTSIFFWMFKYFLELDCSVSIMISRLVYICSTHTAHICAIRAINKVQIKLGQEYLKL